MDEFKSKLTKLRLVQWALIAAVLMFVGVGELAGGPGRNDWIWQHWLVTGFALWAVWGGFSFRRRMLNRSRSTLAKDASDPRAAKQWQAGQLVALAAAENIALWGLLIRVAVGGALWQASLFYAASLALLLLWTPRLPTEHATNRTWPIQPVTAWKRDLKGGRVGLGRRQSAGREVLLWYGPWQFVSRGKPKGATMKTAHVNDQGIVLRYGFAENLSSQEWLMLLDQLRSKYIPGLYPLGKRSVVTPNGPDGVTVTVYLTADTVSVDQAKEIVHHWGFEVIDAPEDGGAP